MVGCTALRSSIKKREGKMMKRRRSRQVLGDVEGGERAAPSPQLSGFDRMHAAVGCFTNVGRDQVATGEGEGKEREHESTRHGRCTRRFTFIDYGDTKFSSVEVPKAFL